MDNRRFNALTCTLADRLTRRHLLRPVSGSILAAFLTRLGLENAAADHGCRHHGATCKKHAHCCSGRCKKRRGKQRGRCKCPAGTRVCGTTACCSGVEVCTEGACGPLVDEQTYNTPGAHAFTAPADGRVNVETLGAGGAPGGRGGSSGGFGGSGGRGGRVSSAVFPVAAGDVLAIQVGGAGGGGQDASSGAPGFGGLGGYADGRTGQWGVVDTSCPDGGGGGGGSSSVSHGGTVKVLAGGGGGGGGGRGASGFFCVNPGAGGAGGRGGSAHGGIGGVGGTSGAAGGAGGNGSGIGPEGAQVVSGGNAAAGGQVRVTFTSS